MNTKHFDTDGNFAKKGGEVAVTWTEANFVLVLQYNHRADFDVVTFNTQEEAKLFVNRINDLSHIQYKSWEMNYAEPST